MEPGTVEAFFEVLCLSVERLNLLDRDHVPDDDPFLVLLEDSYFSWVSEWFLEFCPDVLGTLGFRLVFGTVYLGFFLFVDLFVFVGG